jgi:hypothetical protein
LKDGSHHLQTGLQWELCPHDGKINIRLGQHCPHIFKACPAKKLQTRTLDLLLRVGEDVLRESYEKDLFAHVSSPVRVMVFLRVENFTAFY